jgi:hypothetical protein
MHRFTSTVCGILFAAATLHSQAALASTITWQSPVDETGNASDIVTVGTLVGAATSGVSTTVNGVLFQGLSGFAGGVTSYGTSGISVNGLSTSYASFGSAPGGWDSSYAVLVGGGGYNGSSGSTTLILSGLTAGDTYQVQIFESFWNTNWATNFTGGANTSGNVNLTGGDGGAGSSSVPQYVLGTFTADDSTEDITLHSPTSYLIFTAAQVRTADAVAVTPEPSSFALLGSGLLGLAGVVLRRKTV